MVKKVFLAAAATLFLAGLTLTAAPSESVAGKSHCFKMAKEKFGGLKNLKERRADRKSCKKAWKAAHKGHRRHKKM